MAVKMIEDAERAGLLKPGGTIIEGTSGNTGMGLAIAAVVKGYKCIFTTTDKQSKEKVDALKAFGAEVIVCPTNVDPEDPRFVLFGVVAPRKGSAERLEGEPVRQPVEHAGALRADGTGNLGSDRRPDDAPGGGRRHGWHGVRRRTVPQGAQSENQSVGHRHLRLGVQEIQGDRHLRQERDLPVHHRGHRRGFPPGERRFQRDRPLREGDRQGRRHHDAAHRPRRGHLRRQLRRFGDRRPAAAEGSLRGARRRGGDLSRSRKPLSRQDVQRRLDARKGLPGEDRHDGARSGRGEAVRRALLDRGERAGGARAAPDERTRFLADLNHARERLVGSLNETHLYDELCAIPRRRRIRSNRSCSRHFRSSTFRHRSNSSRR